ncbi:hypothetical protein [Novosphingobium sp. fls2-241-R2A-195]|jgi:hypothetical protein|nr:hypothetical protein [Novosphingobium sp. fls2-241-R2A-195]
MHINTQGAQKRPENATLNPVSSRNGPIQWPAGLLSRDHLQRLVAAMVD